ncbi:hypothetical protein pb186bvf_007621 [Paramecium bursaria]
MQIKREKYIILEEEFIIRISKIFLPLCVSVVDVELPSESVEELVSSHLHTSLPDTLKKTLLPGNPSFQTYKQIFPVTNYPETQNGLSVLIKILPNSLFPCFQLVWLDPIIYSQKIQKLYGIMIQEKQKMSIQINYKLFEF